MQLQPCSMVVDAAEEVLIVCEVRILVPNPGPAHGLPLGENGSLGTETHLEPCWLLESLA